MALDEPEDARQLELPGTPSAPNVPDAEPTGMQT
jgi:hypothetical protein